MHMIIQLLIILTRNAINGWIRWIITSNAARRSRWSRSLLGKNIDGDSKSDNNKSRNDANDDAPVSSRCLCYLLPLLLLAAVLASLLLGLGTGRCLIHALLQERTNF